MGKKHNARNIMMREKQGNKKKEKNARERNDELGSEDTIREEEENT